MRETDPFGRDDLEELDERILSRADRVVSMREIAAGVDGSVIGLRHDVDNTFQACVDLARWESERGYRSTFFMLHDSPYWNDPGLREGLDEIAGLGHEIGLHVNALAVGLQTGRDPVEIVHGSLGRLRSWGHSVTGVVGHGDPVCYLGGHKPGFLNDEMFVECARPAMGAPDRELVWRGRSLRIEPLPLAEFGLEYESYRAGSRRLQISDSGGRWNKPFDRLCGLYGACTGQVHALIHPFWWTDAFVKVLA